MPFGTIPLLIPFFGSKMGSQHVDWKSFVVANGEENRNVGERAANNGLKSCANRVSRIKRVLFQILKFGSCLRMLSEIFLIYAMCDALL